MRHRLWSKIRQQLNGPLQLYSARRKRPMIPLAGRGGGVGRWRMPPIRRSCTSIRWGRRAFGCMRSNEGSKCTTCCLRPSRHGRQQRGSRDRGGCRRPDRHVDGGDKAEVIRHCGHRVAWSPCHMTCELVAECCKVLSGYCRVGESAARVILEWSTRSIGMMTTETDTRSPTRRWARLFE